MARKGEEMVCVRCGISVISNSPKQKYCTDCSNMIQRDRRKVENQKVWEKGFIVGEEMTCLLCGASTIRKSTQQKVCPDCKPEWQRQKVREANRKKAAEQRAVRESEKAVQPAVMPKPTFTLAEVEAAARKNNMNYGKYVAAWKQGKVPAPEHVQAQKKKRGRPKKRQVRYEEEG